MSSGFFRVVPSALVLAAAIGSGVAPALAAQTLRYQVDQKGDFVLLGNTLGYDCANAPPAPVVGTIGACGINATDSGVDTLWRSDQPGAGQATTSNTITVVNARTTAMLDLPADATVTKAFLYWGATRAVAGVDNTITLDRPNGFSQTIVADQTYMSANNSYQGVKEVTSIVQAEGPGAYRVSGVDIKNPIDQSDETLFAGWWMVVLYERASDTPRNLAIFDGLDAVSSGAPQNVTLSGFLVPPAFGQAKLGIVAFEGDTSLTGDQFFFNGGGALTDALNPATNFFNRTRSTFGVATTVVGDLPQLTGTAGTLAGMDMDVVDITSKLTVGQTSAPILANSTGDTYWLAGFVTSIPTFKPDFSTSEKTAVDLNGGALLPGDVVEYTIVATNTGNDTSIDAFVTDVLPSGVTYVPGTIEISAGANAGPKTDALGDDEGEYDSATNTVRVRIGAGATAVAGGTMALGDSATVKFQVTVDADASGNTIDNQAIVNSAGSQGYPASATPTDGNGPAPGSAPTPILIDNCQDDSNCAAPTPYCDVAADPNVCVACLVDAQCGGGAPTCDPMTNTCVCVPSGSELCGDGNDNDCNGLVDEGFDLGTPCSTGIGACEASGTIACTGPDASACNAIPGNPQPEVCDNLDNDCNGVVDDGNPQGGQSCVTAFPGICASGQTSCVAGGTLDCVPNALPGTVVEVCDGVDQDCDGVIDEGFDVGAACIVGVGACQNSGNLVCDVQGGASCDALPGAPGVEICGDGVDDDCNGVVDDNCAGPDTDGDGVPDMVDDCPAVPDPMQVNTDQQNDGGDLCDEDDDDDAVIDDLDNCPHFGPADQTDTDGDGIGDVCDCSHASKQDGDFCDDGNACTLVDTCVDEVCVGSSPVDCSNIVIDAACQVACNPINAVCQRVNKPDNTPCKGGVCIAGGCYAAENGGSGGQGGGGGSDEGGLGGGTGGDGEFAARAFDFQGDGCTCRAVTNADESDAPTFLLLSALTSAVVRRRSRHRTSATSSLRECTFMRR